MYMRPAQIDWSDASLSRAAAVPSDGPPGHTKCILSPSEEKLKFGLIRFSASVISNGLIPWLRSVHLINHMVSMTLISCGSIADCSILLQISYGVAKIPPRINMIAPPATR